MSREERVIWIQHYNSAQKILLVVEGDFSFSACLVTAFGSAVNMVATSLHSEGVIQPLMSMLVTPSLDACQASLFALLNLAVRNKRMHKELLRGFFRSAREMVNHGGEVHVTHRDDYLYNRWKVKKLASKAGFNLKESGVSEGVLPRLPQQERR